MANTRDLALKLRERVLPPGRSRYGLVIGIDRYQDTRLDLRCAAADARLIHGLMVDPDCGVFDEGNVELLLDTDATKDGIWRSLAGLRRKAGPEDTVWVYFAGHAAPEDDQTYWLAHDSDVNDLYATGLGAEQISGALSRVDADRRIVLLDCCHAAATTLQKNPTRAAVPAEELLGRFQGRGAVTLCSSDGGQRSVELEEHGHGAFTYFLERGLRGEADLDGDGVVTAEELWTYLEGRVTKAARKAGVDQSPLMIGQFSHGLPLSVCPDHLRSRSSVADLVHGMIGLGSNDLTTEEARWCLELLSRPAANDHELQLLSLLEYVASCDRDVPGLRAAVLGAMNAGLRVPMTKEVRVTKSGTSVPPIAGRGQGAAPLERALGEGSDSAAKIRVHALAKEYGVSGKRMAEVLMALGFDHVRSHMSVLDADEAAKVRQSLDEPQSQAMLSSGVKRKVIGKSRQREHAPSKKGVASKAAGQAVGGSEASAKGVQPSNPKASAERTTSRIAQECRRDVEACIAALHGSADPELHLKHVFHKRLESWKQASEAGLADGQWLVARCHLGGVAMPRNARKAYFLFRKAAEQGHEIAEYSLGVCYLKGTGVGLDQEEGVRWLQRAASQGLPIASYNLALCYAEGEGVESNPGTALKWLRIASDKDYAPAQFALGRCLTLGEGIPADAKQAFALYQKAATRGDADAQFALGYCYQYGEGVEVDLKLAVAWYEKAASQGDADSQASLGECYAAGEGVARDAGQALFWLRKAAEQGDGQAQFRLGQLLIENPGVQGAKHLHTAEEWIRMAARQGHPEAVRHVKRERRVSTGRGRKASRKKGCFISSSVMAARGGGHECAELQALRGFRDSYMQELPSRIAEVQEYYKVAPGIVTAIDASTDPEIEWDRIYRDHLAPALEALSRGKLAKAHDLYRGMIGDLKSRWPDTHSPRQGSRSC